MHEDVRYYRYGSYLTLSGDKTELFDTTEAEGDLGHVRLYGHDLDKALEKAAKKICNLQCGRCPIQEADFAGCSGACHDEIRPWQCWVGHFKKLSGVSGRSS